MANYISGHDDFAKKGGAYREWDVSHLWTMKMTEIPDTVASGCGPKPKIPGDWKKWMPIIDVDMGLGSGVANNKQIYNTEFGVVGRTSEFEVQLTFMDNPKLELFNFFADWLDFCRGAKGNFARIPPTFDSCHTLELMKTNRKKEPTLEVVGRVYPTGTLQFTGNNAGDLATYTVSLMFATHPDRKKK